MPFKLPAVVMASTALALAGCGSDSPDAPTAGGSTPAATQPAAGNGVDRAFVAAMIPHHRSAVEMAKLAEQSGQSAFVKRLARDIERTQQAEIATMSKEDAALAEAGIKRASLGVADDAMGMGMDMSALQNARDFDREFLRMMIPHHEGAVTMAKAELAKGSDPELKRLAGEIIAGQTGEIRSMRAALG